MYLSCDTKKFHDNESTHILHNFWTSTHREEASPLAAPLPLAVSHASYRTSGSSWSLVSWFGEVRQRLSAHRAELVPQSSDATTRGVLLQHFIESLHRQSSRHRPLSSSPAAATPPPYPHTPLHTHHPAAALHCLLVLF